MSVLSRRQKVKRMLCLVGPLGRAVTSYWPLALVRFLPGDVLRKTVSDKHSCTPWFMKRFIHTSSRLQVLDIVWSSLDFQTWRRLSSKYCASFCSYILCRKLTRGNEYNLFQVEMKKKLSALFDIKWFCLQKYIVIRLCITGNWSRSWSSWYTLTMSPAGGFTGGYTGGPLGKH